MKKISYLLLATALSFAGAQVGLACKKAIKHSAPTNVKLKVDLDRSILPAGQMERAVIKVATDAEDA